MGPGAEAGTTWMGCSDSFFKQQPVRRHGFAFSRQHPPEFCKFISPQKEEGAGKTGCTLHPRSRVPNAHSKKRTRAYRFSGGNPAFPARRFTAYFVLSPARPGLFVTVIPKKHELPRNLTPATGASGPHDFAVRISRARQSQPSRPPLPAPTSATMANAPSLGTGWRGIRS
jgi:hypothetical protein